MAKERFLIIASRTPDDCFSRFSESANRDSLDTGTSDPNDPYSWVEASFEIRLVRWREATHICSFTPSARYVWLANYFVGRPNDAWLENGDPDGLERESGGDFGGYGDYQDDYDPRFVVDEFTVDTMRDLNGLRKPHVNNSLSRRTDKEHEAIGRYVDAIWDYAENYTHELSCNTDWGSAPILDVQTYRQWERENLERTRREACERSKRAASWPDWSSRSLAD